MNHRTAVLSAALVLLGGCSISLGQITPPPADAPAPAQPGPIPPMQAPNSSPVIVTTPRAKEPPVVLPDLPYKPLVERGPDGKIIRLSEPAEYVALRHNPMLKPEDLMKLGDYLKGRKASFEIVVADNLDLVEEIENGVFETFPDDPKDKFFPKMLAVAKPLKAPTAPKPVWQDLKEKGVLTPEQAEFNKKIAGEYNHSLISENEEWTITRKFGMTYKAGLDEPLFYHRLMQIEAAPKLGALLAGMKLDQATSDKAAPSVKKAKDAKTDDEKVAAVKELYKALTIDQRKDLLRALVASRAEKK